MESPGKLPNAPLQEVIFELLWELQEDDNGAGYDEGFDLAQGVFARQALPVLPHHQRLLPESLPIKLAPGIVHRFWRAEGVWPLVQIGPGILAVNDTEKNYVWAENYFPLIEKSLNWLEESYGKTLTFKKASLRYIDAIAVDEENTSLAAFVNKYYHFGINTQFNAMGEPVSFLQRQSFSLGALGNLHISMSDGINRQMQQAIAWEIAAVVEQVMDKQKTLSWLEEVHQYTSRAFKEMIKPSLYERFK